MDRKKEASGNGARRKTSGKNGAKSKKNLPSEVGDRGAESKGSSDAQKVDDRYLDANGEKIILKHPVTPGVPIDSAAAAEAAEKFGITLIPGKTIEEMLEHQKELLRRVQAERDEFERSVQVAEQEIKRAAERMYGVVDNRVNELLAAAAEIRTERSAQMDEARRDMQTSVAAMNYNRMFTEALLKYGSPVDIAQYAPLLHADVERMCQEPIPQVPPMSEETQAKLAALEAFANLDLDEVQEQAGGNLVGQIRRFETIDVNPLDGLSPYMTPPRAVLVISAENAVRGLAFLAGSLFVIRERSSVVEVYASTSSESEELSLSRQINVEQMTSPISIIASTSASCVFVCDSEVHGLFRIPSSVDVDVSVIPLDGIPSGLSVTQSGDVVLTFAGTRDIRVMSAVSAGVTHNVDIGPVDPPILAVPVNGDNNGYLVCCEKDDTLTWFLCGHKLDSAARPLEEPVPLRSLRGIRSLTPDPIGSYIGISIAQNSIGLFDSTFAFLRPLLSSPGEVEYPLQVALNLTNGQLAVGQQNGVIKLYQILRTRETFEVGISNWA